MGWTLRALHRKSVALQAQHVYLAHAQEPWVRRSMGSVTTSAAFRLYWRVLINKRTLLVDVALEADRVAAGQRSDLSDGRCPVNVMAIAAVD